MNLDDERMIKVLDASHYYVEIMNFPDHLATGWEIGKSDPGVIPGGDIDRVIICGMGGSAIGADLAAAFARSQSPTPIVVNREYDLPAWAKGRNTLVIASSHSGETEETLCCFRKAEQRNCTLLAVSTGGELEKMAIEAGALHWKFAHGGQPRAAVGISLGLMLAAMFRFGLIEDPTVELASGLTLIRQEAEKMAAEVPVAKNPAKRLAGQMIGRIPVIFGSDALSPVARRFKTQVNELAKGWAEFDLLPEADHNTAAGIDRPEAIVDVLFGLFLDSASDHHRNRLRSEATRQNFLLEGINCDSYLVPGKTRLENILAGIQFCDFVAFYLAIACGVDPTPIPGIVAIKKSMSERG